MPLRNPKTKINCPTCGYSFPLRAARWRDYKAAKKKLCTAMKQALNLAVEPELPPDRASNFLARWLWGWFAIPRNSRRWKKVCPNCRVDLPSLLASGDGGGERFAIIGSGSTGKSQLIYAWIEELLGPVPASLGISVRLVDTYDLINFKPIETLERWKRDYLSYLAPDRASDGRAGGSAENGRPRQPQVVPKSTLHRIDSPLIVRLTFDRPAPLRHKLIHPRADYHPVDLYFYDTMGEHFDDKARWQQFAGYVLSATGLLLLVDPLACDELRRLTSGVQTQANSAQSARDLIGRLLDLLEDEGRLHANELDTAIVLTKEDLLHEGFARDNPYAAGLQAPDHSRGFNLADVESASADIEAYLRASSHDGLLKLVEQSFGRPGYFACSALGRPPLPDGTLEVRPQPFRVLEPLFWLLHRRGYLTAASLPLALQEHS